ncbi:hypothetical protein DMENIID0001_070370 [Sergentomyia squamirostris]
MEHPSILRLNDQCLLKIFSYLNILELIKLEEVCRRFQNVVEEIYRHHWKKLDFLHLAKELNIVLHSEEAEVIAGKIGAHVNELIIILNSDEEIHQRYVLKQTPIVPNSILQKCSQNIQHLHIEYFNVEDNLDNLNELFDKLKSLKLINCQLRDEDIPALRFATNIRILDLSFNHEMKGSFLPFLRNIEEISLESCFLIQSNFLEFCQNNPTIRSLNVAYGAFIDQECVNSLAKIPLENLEILKIGCNSFVNLGILADFPKLVHVEVKGRRVQDLDVFVERFTIHDQLKHLIISLVDDSTALNMITKFTKLKYLKIQYGDFSNMVLNQLSCKNTLEELHVLNSNNLNSTDLLKCVIGCQALKVLNVRYCEDITDEFVSDLLPHLRSRPGPLEIWASDSKITKNIESNVQHQNLKFNWDQIDDWV